MEDGRGWGIHSMCSRTLVESAGCPLSVALIVRMLYSPAAKVLLEDTTPVTGSILKLLITLLNAVGDAAVETFIRI